MTNPQSPGYLAELDQASAGIDDEIQRLLFVANGLIRDAGSAQAGADLTAFLNQASGHNRVALSAIAARALIKLAEHRKGEAQR
jgi:hypothetical protein